MEPGFIGGPLFFLLGLGLMYGWVKEYLLGQKILNTPTSKVRSVAVGLTELIGNAKRMEKMLSPISNTNCVFWSVDFSYYAHGKHGGRWVSFFKSNSDGLFYLEDDTGKIIIDPKDARIELPSHLFSNRPREFLGKNLPVLDSIALEYISSNPELNSNFQRYSNRNILVSEGYIAEGEVIYILGDAEMKDGSGSSINQDNLVVRKGKSNQILYISNSSEKKIVDSLMGSDRSLLIIGIVLAVLGLYAFITGL